MSRYEQRLEADLTDIRQRVAALSDWVETAFSDAIHALLTGNRQLAYATVLRDARINRNVREIDRKCHSFIARHLPSAGHLRVMSATLRAVLQFERIGDYAVIIAREGVQLSSPPSGAIAREVDLMSSHALRMLRQALAAFKESNASAAQATRDMGEQFEGKLDAIYADLMRA
jgi:phosphate transport system protein